MSETNQTNDLLSFDESGQTKLPSGLNVLTILTFVGCALGFFGGIWQFFSAEKSYRQLEKMRDQLDQMPGFVKKMMGPDAIENARKAFENRLPVMLLGIVGIALCLYGAIEMRKLKKQGFMIWTIGEFLPIIGNAFFLGSGAFSGFALFVYIFPVLFLVLYAVNKKHLVY